MAARLKGDIKCGAFDISTSILDSVDFGMFFAILPVKSPTYHLSVTDNDSTDDRIGAGSAQPLPSQGYCLAHILIIQ
jgi:hypothetical protein